MSWLKNVSKWEAYIWIDNKKKRLGTFANKEDAIAARVQAEREIYGVTVEKEII